jgi:hypothetical protein
MMPKYGQHSITHGHCRVIHNKRSPEYISWRSMRARCYYQRDPVFRYYGGRGISVCERWASFSAFLTDMGLKPTPKHSLDRIDPDGHYEPSNCRWATVLEQRRNRRDSHDDTHRLTLDGVSRTRAEWSEALGGGAETLVRGRLRRGWSLRDALTVPARPRRPNGWRDSLDAKSFRASDAPPSP